MPSRSLPQKMGGRQLKKKILQFLQAGEFEQGLCQIRKLPHRQAVNPLFSFLCSTDPMVKWRAVRAMGTVVSDLAVADPESARVIMRRFIWQLNDESGGIGWGCPESMAEAMAQNESLAAEYGRILISYIQPAGNYLEHATLQQGVLWGVGRLAHTRPRFAKCAVGFLPVYMDSQDAVLRGLAVWAAGPIAGPETIPRFEKLTGDPAELTLYRNGKLVQTSVGRLAEEAITAAAQRKVI